MQFAALMKRVLAEYSHLRFILITAPTARCGVTLIQRMLNADRTNIIYGENMYLMFRLPAFILSHEAKHSYKDSVVSAFATKFYGGAREMDATTLFPDYDTYTGEQIRTFYKLMSTYQNDALSRGALRWGMKCPLTTPGCAVAVLRLLPQTEIISIERNVIDVAKSMFARWPENFNDDEKVRTIGYNWKANSIFLRNLAGPRILHIAYDDWISNPEPIFAEIEERFDLRIARHVFSKKINVHDSDPRISRALARDEGFYLPPRELSSRMHSLIIEGVTRFEEQATSSSIKKTPS